MIQFDKKKHNLQKKQINRRSFILGMTQAGVAVGAISYLIYKQSKSWHYYKAAADKNRVRIRFLKPKRAQILDVSGKPIAINKYIFQVTFLPYEVIKSEKTIEILNNILDLDDNHINDLCLKHKKSGTSKIELLLKADISWKQVSQLAINSIYLKGVYVRKSSSRYYPYKQLFAHVVGTVSTNADTHKSHKKLTLIPMCQIGKTAIESRYEDDLFGDAGMEKIEVNAFGNTARILHTKKPHQFAPLNTTIDYNSQLIAQQELSLHKAGAALTIDITTGYILNMYSSPSFDPNLFSTKMNQAQWSNILNNPLNPLTNRCLQGCYAPGSIFKIVIIVAAMTKGNRSRL